MSGPVRFAIIGTGWRAEFFLRLAAALPEKLQVACVIGRTQSSLNRVPARWHVPVSLDPADLVRFDPEFVAIAVGWDQTPILTVDLAERGFHLYVETPPAPDVEGLRALWARLAGLAYRVQVGEQYYRMPGHAARLRLVRDGVIGDPNSVEIASTHGYHAVALIRECLGVGTDPVIIDARAFRSRLIDPLGFDGWAADPQPEPHTTTIATLDFGDGRFGLYNFVENQWWNPLLHRRIVIRGSLGEIVDNTVLRWACGFPVTSQIEYRRAGVDMSLEGNELKEVTFDGKVVYANPYLSTRLSEDDIAVADHLRAEGAYVRGESGPVYPLAQGIHDHALGLAIARSAQLGIPVRVADEPWMSRPVLKKAGAAR